MSKIFELPKEDVMLYDPQYVIPDSNGDIYIVDYGTYQILRFDSDGNYIMSYGSGVGQGPGEFISISGVEVSSDSLIYVADPNNRRISSFSKVTGRLIDSRIFDGQEAPFRYAKTDTGIEYISRVFNPLFFESNFRNKTVEFGELIEGDFDMIALMIADGMIEAYKDWMIYVPSRFPVIMIYDVDGTLVRAKKTMTFDRFEEPRLEPYVMNGIESYRIEGELVNGLMVNIVGDELFLQSRDDSEDLIVDVYEAETAEYKYSFRISDHGPSVITDDRVYQPTRDATVIAYSINRPS